MMDKMHLERVLTVNGVSPQSSDDEITSILLKARYTITEVTIALQVLRQESTPGHTGANELNRVFRSDSVLNAGEITRLLGIHMSDRTPNKKQAAKAKLQTVTHHVLVVFLGILLALGGIIITMYHLHFGIFHTTSAMHIYDGA